MELVTRREAKARGLKHYFTGKPCPYGHTSKRFTSIGACMECCRVRARQNHTHITDRRRAYSDLEGFIAAASVLHKGVYSYTQARYEGAHKKLDVVCPVHGVFSVSPTNHIQGKGCPDCWYERVGDRNRSSTASFIETARKLWGDRYDYSRVEYTAAHQKVEIVCPEHGSFWQTPTNHLSYKQACGQCGHMRSSGEDAVFQLISTFTPAQRRNRALVAPKEIDIYTPANSLAVEYCGDYWHSHNDQADERNNRRRHMEKYQACAEQGVRLITLYESEWQDRRLPVCRLLRAAMGKLRGRVMARKCELRSVSVPASKRFFDRYHIQGGAGGGVNYGLYWNDRLVACMRFWEGANDRGRGAHNRVWTLSRYATRINVVGGASRLFRAFLREYDPELVKSFSDNRLFSGGMYTALGFELDATLPPDYEVWSPKLGRRPKSHYQRRLIPARLKDHDVDDAFDPDTDPRTEAEMTYTMGARRLYDCGKKRWIWQKS